MSFYTTNAFMLRENNGDLGIELPSDIKELLKQRGLTVVFVSGDVQCDGEYVGIKDIYGKEYRVRDDQWNEEQLAKAKESDAKPYGINKINPLIADIINAVITERLDVSEPPIVCDASMKPDIIILDGVFDALGKQCVIKPV